LNLNLKKLKQNKNRNSCNKITYNMHNYITCQLFNIPTKILHMWNNHNRQKY